jgi:hypothetical protein
MLLKKLQFLAFVLLFAMALQAQTTKSPANPESDSTQVGSELETTPVASAPPAHSDGEGPQLTVETDPEYKNVLVGNVVGSAAYDDHAMNSKANPGSYVGDVRFALQPSIAFQQTRQRASWTLSYTPGVSISQHDTSDYQYTQNGGAEVTWDPSTRFHMRLRQDYTVTTNPFESVGREPVLPTLGGFTGPTSNTLLPNTKREMMISSAEIMTRVSPHGAFGFTGGYQKFDYGDIPGTENNLQLTGSHTYLGTAFYSLQVSRSTTIGVQTAVFDIFSSLQGILGERTQSYDVQVYDAWKMTARSVLTIYTGAEYSREFEPNFPLAKHWRPDASASYAWNGVRNAVTLDYVRRTSDGGGVVGSALTNHGVANLRSRITKTWGLEGRFEATDQIALQGFLEFRSFWAGGAITHDWGRNLRFRLDYDRVRQNAYESKVIPAELLQLIPSTFPVGEHNLIQFSVDYHFMRPISR